MAHRPQSVPGSSGWILLLSSVTLGLQRVRQAWGLLLMTGAGMLAAVMLVCAVPLYSEVAMTAGLRGTLNTYSQNGDIVVRSLANLVSSSVISNTTQQLNQEFQEHLGPYLTPTQYSVQTPQYALLAQSSNGSFRPLGLNMGFIGAPVDKAAPHVRLLQGRLPRVNSDVIEIAVLPRAASDLQATVGTVLHASLHLINLSQKISSHNFIYLTLRVVGIFTLATTDDPFWHGEDFVQNMGYTALASNQTLISVLTRASQEAAPYQQIFDSSLNILWYYHLDTTRITIGELNTIFQQTQTVEADISNNPAFQHFPFLLQTQIYEPFSNILNDFHARSAVAQLSVVSLLILILSLVLFFVSMMASLLVDRQADAIAILRSRGASRRQVLGSLVIQGIGLGLIALVLGPLLALLIVWLLAQSTLAAADQGALNVITTDPLRVALGLGPFALAAVGISIITLVVAVLGATRRDVLAIRREAARSSYRPLWQRLNLDLFAALFALVSYGAIVYLTNSHVLDAHLRLLLLSPLALIQSVCLLLACLLLLLRLYPLLLRLGAWIAAHRRGAAPLVALAQMARAPRQSVRMTLLLALASAFAIFTLVFTATQRQRILDVAAYQAGADFSGTVPINLYTPQQLNRMTSVYRHLPGVISATLGLTKPATAGGATVNVSINFKAVDANTFASTALWTQQDSSQSLSSLMGQLAAQRASGIARAVVPAVVDANTASFLHVSEGANFTLNFALTPSSDLVSFKVVAVVQNIPTSGDSSLSAVLVDYQTFADVYTKHFTRASEFNVPLNYVWLRTRDDAASLASVRKALSQGNLQLNPLFDRRATIATLYHEPLYLSLIGVLILGAVTALLLALVGNLIASWLSARSRLTNFAVLRALGTAPRQVASVLSWEQGMVYSTAIVLGIIFGMVLSVLVLPALIFTSVLPTYITGDIPEAEFYAAQSAPPIHMIIPTSLGIALGVFVAICVVALGMMLFIVSRPSLSQALRLNED